MDLYKAELRATIEKNKYYPTMSRRLGQTGTVVIAFTLLEDGNIVDIRVDKPSQYERLNVSALDAVKKVERFKPIPKEIGEDKMDIKVPVKFVTL
jgi:protein TonB